MFEYLTKTGPQIYPGPVRKSKIVNPGLDGQSYYIRTDYKTGEGIIITNSSSSHNVNILAKAGGLIDILQPGQVVEYVSNTDDPSLPSHWYILGKSVPEQVQAVGYIAYGSVNTQIMLYNSVLYPSTTSITYQQNSTDGASFHINYPGCYSIVRCRSCNTNGFFGLSLNSTHLTVPIYSLVPPEAMAYGYMAAATYPYSLSWTGHLNAGDIVRPHDDNAVGMNGTEAQYNSFYIARIS